MDKNSRRGFELVSGSNDSGVYILELMAEAGSEGQGHSRQGQATSGSAGQALRTPDYNSESERLVQLILHTQPKRCPKRNAVIAAQILESLK